jgi:superfamily II DNA helicase RecQ
MNEFLETVASQQIFASVINGEIPYWSILIFYENKTASATVEKTQNLKASENPSVANILTSESTKAALPKREVAANLAPEPIKLTAEQENSYNALRTWRNERASQDGVPPYLIAHNDSLMQMATMRIETPEDLLQVKGLGEKRVEKYGDEILGILKSSG